MHYMLPACACKRSRSIEHQHRLVGGSASLLITSLINNFHNYKTIYNCGISVAMMRSGINYFAADFILNLIAYN